MKRTSEKILKAVLDTYAYSNIKTFPVDLEMIAKAIGYAIKTYDEYSCGEGYTYSLLMEMSKDGIVLKNDRLILVNEKRSDSRRRFTIAHEIGHIVMPDASEHEADEFASQLLAPSAIIYSRKINKVNDISEYFDISIMAANMCKPHPDYMPYVNGFDKEIIRWFGDESLCPDLFIGSIKSDQINFYIENYAKYEPVRNVRKTDTSTPTPPEFNQKAYEKKKIRSLKGKITRLRAKMTYMTAGDEEAYEKAQKRLSTLIRELRYVTGDKEYTW